MKPFLAIITFILGGFYAVGQEGTVASNEPEGIIDVIGEAEMKLQPDYFPIHIAVEHEDADPEKAQQTVMQEVREVLTYLKETQGIQKVQTQHIDLRAQFRGSPNDDKTFHARQMIQFELTDTDAYDEVVLSLLQKGIDGISNVQFRSSEEDKYKQILLRQAVMNAREKAELLAGELGQEVGKASYISDRLSRGPEPVSAEMYKTKVRSSSSVEPGEITLSATVSVQFKLN